MPDDLKLSEEHRAKLDGIVQQMELNKEPQESIMALIADFKQKYGTKDITDGDPLKKKEPSGALLQSPSPLVSANTESSLEAGDSAPSGPDYLKGSNQIDLPKPQQQLPTDQQPVDTTSQLRAATTSLETTAKDQENFIPDLREKEIMNQGTGSDLKDALHRGVGRLGLSILETPAFLYDIVTTGVNKVINEPLNAVTGGAVGYMPSADDIAQKLPADNPTAALRDALAQETRYKQQKYEKEINEYFFGDDPDIGKGITALALGVTESAPTTISLMLGNAAGLSGTRAMLAGGAVFGADKMANIDTQVEGAKKRLINGDQLEDVEKLELQSQAGMTQVDKVSTALATGLFEGVFEQWGLTKLGGMLKNVFIKSGAQPAKDLAEKSFMEVYAPLLKKYLGVGAQEVASEVATQFAENVVDKYSGLAPDLDLGTGLKEAAWIALGSSGAMTGPVAALDVMVTKANRQKAIKLSEERKALEADLASEVNETTKATIAKKLRDINELEADLAAAEKEIIDGLPPEAKQQINEIQSKARELAHAATDPGLSEESREILAKDMEKLDGEVDKVIEAAPAIQKEKERVEAEKKQEEIDELEYLKDVEENIGLDEDEYARMLELEQKLSPPVAVEGAVDQKPAGEVQETESAAPGAEPVASINEGLISDLQGKINQNKLQFFNEKIDYTTYRANNDRLQAQLQEAVSPKASKENAQPATTESTTPEAGTQPTEAAQGSKLTEDGKEQKTTTVPAGNRIFNEPIKEVKGVAEKYFEKAFPGKSRPKFFGSKKFDRAKAKRIAEAYKAMKHDPENPEVKAAYDAMAKETLEQWKSLEEAGIQIEVNNEEPYKNSDEMIQDVTKNKRIRILGTESGFGDQEITDNDRKVNPLLADSGVKDKNGNPLLVNDVFRAVHDLFGHGELGNSFGAKGEENAWNVHARMYSPLARRAMTSETRGQNSFVNFSGINEKVEGLVEQARKLRNEGKTEEADKIVEQIYKDLSFADQKIGLLPEEFSELDENDIGDEDRIPADEMAAHSAPKKEPGSSVEPSVEPKKSSEIKAPEKVTKKEEDPVQKPVKPKQELVDEEEQAETERKDDPAALAQLDFDLIAMKKLSNKDLYDKKFTAMIERAWKAKNDKKISRPTYTAFRNAASDVLGGKHKYDKEELKVKVGEIFNKIKEKLVGDGYKKITLSSISPITPKTVADLIDLAASLTKKGIDAGFAINEALQKALNAIKKHPVYKKLVKSGELDEAKFDDAVKQNVVKPAKKKKKKVSQTDQPAEITGEVRKRKTVDRQESNASTKEIVEGMTEDEKYYHSIKESQVEPHIDKILNEVQANNGLESLAQDMLNDENPFHEKIAYVAEFMLGERIAVIAEQSGNEMQKSAGIKLASKLMAHANSRVTISATQTAMQNVVAKRLPVSTAALQGYAAAAVVDIQDSHMTSTQQQDVKSFVKDHLDEIMEIEDVKKKVSEATEAEINRVAEGTKGKEWSDKVSSAMSSLKIDIKDC